MGTTHQTEQRGLWLGLLAVTLFALSLPMTKLAVGSHDAPLLSPWFSSFGRAAVAGLLSMAYLWYSRARWPVGNQWRTLVLIGLGNAIGFPILQTVGLLYVPSSHAAVFNGLLPLATAAIAALIFRQHAPIRFWLWAGLAALFVVLFALSRAYVKDGFIAVHGADVLLFFAIVFCGFGYAQGAKLAREMPAAHSLSWMLVVFLPITLPCAIYTAPSQSIPWSAWLGFAYIAIFSMWIGMMIWFYALHIGGAVRVSQVQILQPFLTILFSIPLLGESFSMSTLLFAAAVIWAAYMGKRVPIASNVAAPSSTNNV